MATKRDVAMRRLNSKLNETPSPDTYLGEGTGNPLITTPYTSKRLPPYPNICISNRKTQTGATASTDRRHVYSLKSTLLSFIFHVVLC